MDRYPIWILGVVLLINFSCSNTGDTEKLHAKGDVMVDQGGNVVNQLDDHNLKQGKWMIWREGDEKTMTNVRSLEYEGYYKDDKKVGYWKEYSKCSELIDSVLYIDGVQKIDGTKTHAFSSN